MGDSNKIQVQQMTRAGSAHAVEPRAPRRAGAEFERRLTETPLREDAARQQALEELRLLVRAIRAGVTDPVRLTDAIFYTRHPEMQGVPLTGEHRPLLDEWNGISRGLVHPTLQQVAEHFAADVSGERAKGSNEFASPSTREAGPAGGARDVNRFDDIIAGASDLCPGLSPAILKSLLAQESNFRPDVINQYGYAGIAQFGREAAREVGLRVGVAGSAGDERLNPVKAIPAAARLLNLKAERLREVAFSRYGEPQGVEAWKFVLAAYNGGEGTVTVAMGHAYRRALAEAGARGLNGTAAVNYARSYASKWENLKAGGMGSPLGLAASRYFPHLAAQKYEEIGNYPTAIVARASRQGFSPMPREAV
jgi:soluble lytic murein transglycosylase-like protein